MLYTTRAVVGMAEASFTVVPPALIADVLPVGNRRSAALMLYYLALPVGTGVDYAAAQAIAPVSGDWRWDVRMSPIGATALWLVVFTAFREPQREQHAEHQQPTTHTLRHDLVALLRKLAPCFTSTA